MSLADKFASILCKELNLTDRESWHCNGRIGNGREAVDVCGEMNGKRVYIEIELRRDEPLTNVVKLWRAIEEDHHPKRVILVHAFSGHYPSSNTHRLNAQFIGKRMEKYCGARYFPLSFKFRPKKSASVLGDYRRRAAKSLAADIRNALETI